MTVASKLTRLSSGGSHVVQAGFELPEMEACGLNILFRLVLCLT
jgi:hypothetical protein